MLKNTGTEKLNVKQLLNGFFACTACTLCFIFSTTFAIAGQSSIADSQETYIPGIYYLRNPLRNEGEGNKVIRFDSSFALDNDDLLRAVSDMQDLSMSTSHRLLNHQWLSAHEDDNGSRQGGRAVSKILLTGLKTFWDNRYGNKLYKGKILQKGSGSYYSEMDYRIRLSDDSLKMSVEYSF